LAYVDEAMAPIAQPDMRHRIGATPMRIHLLF
jgi:hypothetical protein